MIRIAVGISLVVALLGLSACKKDESAENASKPVTKEEMQQAFAGAAPEVRQAAEQAAGDSAGVQSGESLERLQALSEVPDLTPEQRQAIARSRNAMLKQLQAEAAGGSAQAQQVIQRYQSSR